MLSVNTTRRAKRGMIREWRLHALSVFSLVVAFVCLGAALLVVTNLRAVETRWAHAGRASVYLKDGASQDDVDALRAAVVMVPGVTSARYVSSGDARAQFGTDMDGHNALASLPAEAFPASIELDVAPDMPDADLASMIGEDETAPHASTTSRPTSLGRRSCRKLVRGGVAAAALLAAVVFAGGAGRHRLDDAPRLAATPHGGRGAQARRRDRQLRPQALRHRGQCSGSPRGNRRDRPARLALLSRARSSRRRISPPWSASNRAFSRGPSRARMVFLGALLGATAALASLRKLVAIRAATARRT